MGDNVRDLLEQKLTRTHSINLCVNGNNATQSGSFGVEYIPKEI